MVTYRKTVAVPGALGNKPDFLRIRFREEELVLVMVCSAILVLTAVLPYVSRGYDMERTYSQMITVLSTFFVIGGIIVAKTVRVKPPWVMLLVLVPFFLSTSGVIYQLQGYPASIILNSSGREYASYYVDDEESHAAQWLARYRQEDVKIYPAAIPGIHTLTSQGNIPAYSPLTRVSFVEEYPKKGLVDGYIFLRKADITVSKTLEKFAPLFAAKSRIYTSGGSEVYR